MKKILIVDDNPMNIRMAEIHLKKAGYDVVTALSGAACLETVEKEEETFDLILLDIMMPQMDGLQTYEKLRGIPKGKTMPIVFLSAAEDATLIEKARSLGAQGFVSKPFVPEQLVEAVENSWS